MAPLKERPGITAETANIKAFGGKPLVVVAEDDVDERALITSLLKAALGDVEVFGTDTYTIAIDKIRNESHRVIGVVSDIHYYEDEKNRKMDELSRCGLWMPGDVMAINPRIPIILQSSDEEYGSWPSIKGKVPFISKDLLEKEGAALFKKTFGPLLTDKH
jgi:hypothetical protein